ncbi:MAG TPA: rhombosortase [Steroidobacteraceae bacterium]|nr:rhombosortase [Steroidobacteraceae bacterium]
MSMAVPWTRLHRLSVTLNCDGRRGIALVGIIGTLLLLLAGGDSWRSLLAYDRTGIAAGQWWRLLSAHVVHLGPEHALLNCAGLLLVWALFARDYSAAGWAAIVLATIAAIDAGLWFRDWTVQWYVGSSGVLHGALAAGVLAQLRRGEAQGWLLAAFLLLKLGYEQHVGPLPLTRGGAVIVDAHLYGAAGGLCAATTLAWLSKPL